MSEQGWHDLRSAEGVDDAGGAPWRSLARPLGSRRNDPCTS